MVVKRKIPSPHQELNPRTPIRTGFFLTDIATNQRYTGKRGKFENDISHVQHGKC
jgi:hypothetical protein